jgi:hypothetical protein
MGRVERRCRVFLVVGDGVVGSFFRIGVSLILAFFFQ